MVEAYKDVQSMVTGKCHKPDMNDRKPTRTAPTHRRPAPQNINPCTTAPWTLNHPPPDRNPSLSAEDHDRPIDSKPIAVFACCHRVTSYRFLGRRSYTQISPMHARHCNYRDRYVCRWHAMSMTPTNHPDTSDVSSQDRDYHREKAKRNKNR